MHKVFLIVLLTIQCAMPTSAMADGFGTFVGRVVTAWKPNGRTMELIEPFRYVDPSNVIWHAPEGSEIDGASIPRFAWSFIGGPFEGKYREASVIHDIACDTKSRPWQDVHKAFYNAMMARGVDATTAKIMYAAVYHFGPRWGRQVQVNLGVNRVGNADDEVAKTLLLNRAMVAKRPDESYGLFAGVTEVPVPSAPPTAVADAAKTARDSIVGSTVVGVLPGPGTVIPNIGIQGHLPASPAPTMPSSGQTEKYQIATIFFSPLKSDASEADFEKVEKAIKEGNLTTEQIESFFPQR